ncbi:MAG: signal peptidase I [Syntrophomonadaceae bacterium]|nr:signal peptidase I [Syntrophomonadaceae bacterium]
MAENEQATPAEPKRTGLEKALKIIGNVVWGLLLILIAISIFFFVQYKITGGTPQILGHRMYIVLSGSMEPAFSPRSLIFVKPMEPEEIHEGDIITFTGAQANSKDLTTHRVIEIERDEAGQLSFVTKGDANDVNDPYPVPGDRLIGKVNLALPFLGAVMDFAQTKEGILALIIVPGVLLIGIEARGIIGNLAKKPEPDNPDDEV